MNKTIKTFISLTIFFAATTASAAPSCHCFQDRTFEPAAPQAIEPYLLTTTSNSLLAVLFDVPKRTIVKSKMGGVDNSDIWVGYSLAEHLTLNTDELLQRKNTMGSWRKLLQSLRFDPEKFPPHLISAIAAGKTTEELADIAVAALLDKNLGIHARLSLELLAQGVTRKQLVLATLIATVKQVSLDSLIQQARSDDGGWARISFENGIAPGQMEALWRMVLKQKKAAS